MLTQASFSRLLLRSGLVWLLLLVCVSGACLAEEGIPTQLHPWVEWVRKPASPVSECYQVTQGSGIRSYCTWSHPIELKLAAEGGSFAFKVQIDRGVTDKSSRIELPGSLGFWPQQVRVTSVQGPKFAPVVLFDRPKSVPYVELPPGEHLLEGIFKWHELPQNLRVPAHLAVIKLLVDNEPRQVLRDTQGRLTFEGDYRSDSAQKYEVTSIGRRLTDGAPTLIQTRLKIIVEGQAGEFDLSRGLIEGATELGLESKQRYRWIEGKRLFVELNEGLNEVVFNSLLPDPLTQIKLAKKQPVFNWTDTELWSIVSRSNFRTVSIEGSDAQQRDPSRVDVPKEWSKDPLYAVDAETALELKSIKSKPAVLAARLRQNRESWVDFANGKIIHAEAINGYAGTLTRLNFKGFRESGFVRKDSNLQLITTDKAGNAGVEIREDVIALTSGSSEELDNHGARLELPVSGWQSRFDRLDWKLHVPGSWVPIFATGADSVEGLWWQAFSPSRLLLLFGCSLSAWFAWGIVGAILFFGCGVVGIHTSFPAWLMILNLGLLAYAKAKNGGPYLDVAKKLLKTFVVVGLIGVIYCEVYRNAGTPLNAGDLNFTGDRLPVAAYNDSRKAGALVIVLAGLGAMLAAILKRYRLALALFVIAVGAFTIRCFVSSRFNDSSLAYYDSGSSWSASRGMTYAPAEKTVEFEAKEQFIPQTGVSIPSWQGTVLKANWHADLDENGKFSVVLLPRWVFIVLECLLVLLVAGLLEINRGLQTRRWGSFVSGVFLIAVIMTGNVAKAEDFPPEYLLKQLEERVNVGGNQTPNVCRYPCFTIEHSHLKVSNRAVRLRALVHAKDQAALIIPAQISVAEVLLGGVQVPVFGDASQGAMVKMPQGINELEIHGRLLETKAIDFGFAVGQIDFEGDGWQINQESTLKMQPKSSIADSAETAIAWMTLRREFSLGSTWRVVNKLRVWGETGDSSVVEVPLLKGERVISNDSSVRSVSNPDKERFVRLQVGSQTKELKWISELGTSQFGESHQILVPSLSQQRISQSWSLSCDAVYLCSPITEALETKSNPRSWEWEADSDDSLKIVVQQLPGIAGATKTLQKARYQLESGERSNFVSIDLVYDSSMRQTEQIELPKGSKIITAVKNAEPVVLRKSTSSLAVVELDRGVNHLKLRVSYPRSRNWLIEFPKIEPETKASETIFRFLNISAPGWLVWAGPALPMGPVAINPWVLVSLIVGITLLRATFCLPALGLGCLSLAVLFSLPLGLIWVAITLAILTQLRFKGLGSSFVGFSACVLLMIISLGCFSLALQPMSSLVFHLEYLDWIVPAGESWPWVLLVPNWFRRILIVLWFAVLLLVWRKTKLAQAFIGFIAKERN